MKTSNTSWKTMLARLGTLTFQSKLGSMLDKSNASKP